MAEAPASGVVGAVAHEAHMSARRGRLGFIGEGIR